MRPAARTVLVLGALAGINVLAQRSRLDADVVVPVGALTLLVGARASGLSWSELGLDAAQSSRGARVSAVAAAVTVAGVAAAASLPGAAGFRDDARYPDRRSALRGAFATIPLSVAVPEELLFRSVLDASLRQHLSVRGAAATHAAVFGLWHALGAVTLTEDNAGIGRALGNSRHRSTAGVVAAVLGTAAAGFGFDRLRRSTDSALPGMAVHWALNASAALSAGLPERVDS